MSALCGLFYRRATHFNPEIFQEMFVRLNHWGPDGHAQWNNHPMHFGFHKRAITPESHHEILPVYDKQHHIALVCDARLDNRHELYSQLDFNIPESHLTDSQFILAAYIKWRERCVDYLLGDYVIAIWDEVRQSCFLISDHCGMRPIYYYCDEQIFAFANEIRSLLAIPQIACHPNLKKIASLSLYELGECAEQTYFKNIYALAPATLITITARQFTRQRYWYPQSLSLLHYQHEEDYIEQFLDIFRAAVTARLRSAYPVASLLSGGLDSSAITGMAAYMLQQHRQRLPVFSSVASPSLAVCVGDESDYIRAVAEYIPNLDLHSIYAPNQGPFDDLDELVAQGESALYTSRHYLYTAFAKRACELGARTILDGCYGEFGPSFHGKGFLSELLLRGKYIRFVTTLRQRAQHENRNILKVFREALKPLVPDLFTPSLYQQPLFSYSFLRSDFVKQQLGTELKNSLRQLKCLSRDLATSQQNKQQNLDFFLSRPRRNNCFVGSQFGEIVFPYADKRLLEFCLRLPSVMHVKHGYKRYMIRAAMKDFLPDKVRYRMTKEPFSPDYHLRYNQQKQQALEVLENIPQNELIDSIIDRDQLKQQLQLNMLSNRGSNKRDFMGLQSVPQAIYLMKFLQHFFC